MNLFLGVGALSLVTVAATAQTSGSTPPANDTSTPAATSTPAKLPYGVDDVVKLNRAQVSEDVTLNFIQNAGTIYNLSPKDIVYLKGEGVSDRVINAMIGQGRTVPAAVAADNAIQAQAAAPTPPAPDANSQPMALTYPPPAPVYVQPVAVPVPVPVQVEPDYVPPSTLYVIPYSSSGSIWYRYPSAYRSFGCGSTVVTIGSGCGGGRSYASAYRGGHFRGGWRH